MKKKPQLDNPITLDTKKIFGQHWIEPHQSKNVAPTKMGGTKPSKLLSAMANINPNKCPVE